MQDVKIGRLPSTPTKSPPIWGDLTENRGNRRFIRVLVWLTKPVPCGRAMECLSAGAWKEPIGIPYIIYTIVKTPRGLGAEPLLYYKKGLKTISRNTPYRCTATSGDTSPDSDP